MMSATPNFKDLQRKARKIEIHIDHQLSALSKIKKTNRVESRHDEQPLLDEDDTNNRKNELEDLLSRFSAVLDELSDAAELSQNGMKLRSVQQLREAYETDLEEFRKMCSRLSSEADVRQQESVNPPSIKREMRKMALMEINIRVESREGAPYSARRPKNDAVLRENQSAHSSIQMVDEHIALALETREQLGVQRARFKSIQTRMNDIFSHFPRVSSLIQRIHSRKRLEAIILGVLIGVLTIASLAFLFS